MVEMRSEYKILVGKPEGKRPLGRLRLYRRIIIERILKKQFGGRRSAFICLRIGTSGGLL
jgi:hypothetical protein